jgi:hypothetical protein
MSEHARKIGYAMVRLDITECEKGAVVASYGAAEKSTEGTALKT